VLAALVREENVVDNVADKIVGVVADLLAGAIVTAGRQGRRLAAVVVVVGIVEASVVAASVSPSPSSPPPPSPPLSLGASSAQRWSQSLSPRYPARLSARHSQDPNVSQAEDVMANAGSRRR
jgi:hypothetical protein